MLVDMLENISIKINREQINVRFETVSLIQQDSMHALEDTISENFTSDHEISEQGSDSTEDLFR